MKKLLLRLLLLLPTMAIAATPLVNCAINTPCVTTGAPLQTGTGDPLWMAFGKYNTTLQSSPLLGGNLSGDCTTSGSLLITCLNTNGVPFGTFATQSYATPPTIGGTTPAPIYATTLSNTGGAYSSLAINRSGAYTAPALGLNAFGWNGSLTGSVSTNNYAAVDFISATDNVAATGILYVLKVNENAGGVALTGNRSSFGAIENVTAATGNAANAGFYGAGTFVGQATSADGGTSFGSPGGHLFGINPNVRLTNGATFWDQLIGQENDIAIQTGASANDVIGEQIVQTNLSAVQANRFSAAYELSDQTGAVGFQYGLLFGAYEGYWPMTSTGTMIGCYAHANTGSCGTTGIGIDFSNVTLSSYFLKSTGFTVDGSGNLVANAINSTPIGGTTPAAVTGTAVTANNIELTPSQSAAGNGFFNGIAGNQINVSIGGGAIGNFAATGLNNMAVGAATASTGAFTTLVANGITSINASNNTATNIGTGSTTSAVNIGGGSNTVVVGSNTNMTGVLTVNLNNNAAINLGTGTDTSTVTLGGGANTVLVNGAHTVTGTTNINASNNAVTNIGTGTTTSVVNIGGTANIVQVKGVLESSVGTVFTVASGTGTCGTTGSVHATTQAGDFTCTTAGTAASTVTLTLQAATTSFTCWGRDITTPTVVTQTGVKSTTSVTLTLTSVTANDVIQFGCLGY